ncbi:hypothetical protein [Parasphaerochaeta coccoides]|nr:hypothetical protein [Parasphaerochaeta coccoides]
MENAPAASGYRRRWGDRRDGRRLRTLAPYDTVSPYIMVGRNDSQNLITDSFECTAADRYVRHKRTEGYEGFGILHLIIAAYVRLVSQCPRVNRFIAGQKVFAAHDITVNIAIKREMNINETTTVIKIRFAPEDTATDVYRKFTEVLQQTIKTANTNFDNTAKIVNTIPGLLKKFAVWFLKTLDYFGKLPHAIIKVSPFHGSMFITSMASLGIPPIHHHLYNFGTVPVFIAFGTKRPVKVLDSDGALKEKKYIDYTVVTDERICDGFYFASCLKRLRRYLANPSMLDTPPETVVRDCT